MRSLDLTTPLQLLPHYSPLFLSGKSPWNSQLCSLSSVSHFILYQAHAFGTSETALVYVTKIWCHYNQDLCPIPLLAEV